MPDPLPIDAVLPQLITALQHHPCAVLTADVGAGKTTRVPPALLAAMHQFHSPAFGADTSGSPTRKAPGILLLEPRRIAARSAAGRMSAERGESVGRTIGFQVRFERRSSQQTRILVITEGILLRQLLDDPFLEDIGIVIFDEFHERRLDSDLALAMTRRVQQTVRPDLRIVVMSATLEASPIASWLGECPIVRSEGRTFPVTTLYQLPTPQTPIPRQAADA
ncbi:MAG: DEAD/DEAH box helicase, partial [Planctomycetaceae bacterium]|nr:DEAD/DEAH box helicase [Planctomycetaceae bacterium]